MDKFCPTWKELLYPVRLPVKQYPECYNKCYSDVEPDSYIHLGIRNLDPTEDFNKKIKLLTEKEVVYADFGDLNKEDIDEYQLLDCCDINLLPDNETGLEAKDLKININNCLGDVLENIPLKELAEHGILVQTYRILESEFNKSQYRRRIDEIVTEFLTKTVVYNNIIKNDNIVQIFLYEGFYSQPGRIFTKYSTDRSKEYIEDILKDFINQFEKQNELKQLTELIYLEHYNLSPTLYTTLKKLYAERIIKRPFFKDINLFMESPCFRSATHGLQRLCRRKILFYFIKSHVKFLISQLRCIIELTQVDEDKLCKVFLQTCVLVLALPEIGDW